MFALLVMRIEEDRPRLLLLNRSCFLPLVPFLRLDRRRLRRRRRRRRCSSVRPRHRSMISLFTNIHLPRLPFTFRRRKTREHILSLSLSAHLSFGKRERETIISSLALSVR